MHIVPQIVVEGRYCASEVKQRYKVAIQSSKLHT